LNAATRRRARALGKRIAAEDGLHTAVRYVHSIATSASHA
jgi:hypothetical protein